MRQSIKIFLSSAILLAFACASDKTKEKSIEEIRATDLTGNAAIIRNPISAADHKDTINVAKMEFETTNFEFGVVEAGEIVTHTFKFTNTGKVPLIISDARSTCGCTVPEWPKDLIPPNGKGEISVRFNTTNMRQQQRKPVTITANTYPSKTKLYLSGIVKDKEAIK